MKETKAKGNKGLTKIFEQFDLKIKEQEDILFGWNLYYQGICLFHKHDKATVDLTRTHYENTKRRMTDAISQAQKLLEKAKKYPDKHSLLKRFEFPSIGGIPILDYGTKLAKALAEAYGEIFLGRPKSKLLTKEEDQQLIRKASEKI